MGTDIRDMVYTLVVALVCSVSVHHRQSQTIDNTEEPWWRRFEVTGDLNRRDLRGDKDGFWAVRGKRSIPTQTTEPQDEVDLYQEYKYLQLLKQFLKDFGNPEGTLTEAEALGYIRRLIYPDDFTDNDDKPLDQKRSAVKPNGLFTYFPGKRALKPNGLFSISGKRGSFKPNGIFKIPGKRSLKPNGFFLLKRMFKPNGLFSVLKRGGLKPNGLFSTFKRSDYPLDDDEVDYNQDLDEFFSEDDILEMAKRDNKNFWAVRGKKDDTSGL